jgi:hypothetical protein
MVGRMSPEGVRQAHQVRPLIHLPRYCRSDSEDVSRTTKAPNPRQGQQNKIKNKIKNSAEERDRTEIRSKGGIPG